MTKFLSHLMLATYQSNTHKFMSDGEMGKIYEVTHTHVSYSRKRLIKEGHSFAFNTSVTKSNMPVQTYKYVGQTNLGLVCVDEKKDAMDGDTLLRLRYRMQSPSVPARQFPVEPGHVSLLGISSLV
ncbi:hypothetical protein NVP1072O_42 [Vibrio phage 1.072.O._10N.286.48.A12]|nr:hypothetical protein NVP1004O_41 [Vibrio phage 1.004.O._10N.261.54.A2]AUR85359.1 hypothetical protein NVP1072O_42 [Vibrio phage 1.072.O._10N.286.48.A12]